VVTDRIQVTLEGVLSDGPLQVCLNGAGEALVIGGQRETTAVHRLSPYCRT